MPNIAERLHQAQARIEHAISAAKRAPNAVTLLAVSKTKPADMVREAHQAGAIHFGENYVQEGIDKIAALTDLNLIWHFIGPLQSNKTRLVAQSFAWVHSVDRLKIAQRLSEQRPAELPLLNVCIQVNISDESSKSGVAPDQVEALAAQISALPNLKLRGLMAIPAFEAEPKQQRIALAQMQQLFVRLQQSYPELDTLSMGMSDDLEAAILEGSTMVRIGTAIFGSRQ